MTHFVQKREYTGQDLIRRRRSKTKRLGVSDAAQIDWYDAVFFEPERRIPEDPDRYAIAPYRGDVVVVAFDSDGDDCAIHWIRRATAFECSLLGAPLDNGDGVVDSPELTQADAAWRRRWRSGDPVGETACATLMTALEEIKDAAARGDLETCAETARWTLIEERERQAKRLGNEGY